MERDQIEINSLVDELRSCGGVVCRMSLRKRSEGWVITNLLADINLPNQENPSWTSYEYSDVAFLHGIVSVDEFISWLTNQEGKLHDIAFQLPKPEQKVERQRYSTGLGIHNFYHLPCPFTLYSVRSADRDDDPRSNPLTPLVRNGLPSFPNYETAVYRFLFDRAFQSGHSIPQNLVVIRWAHVDAWIDEVESESDAIEVILKGDQCMGSQLTIGGPEGILVNEAISKEGRHRFEIKNANSNHLWLVLSREDLWLDWRDISGTSLSSSWDISGVQPGNLSVHIEQLLLQGENERLEYKVRIPDKEDKFLKTVAAFANGSGGIILVGVADDGKVEGVKEDLARYMDSIVDSIRNRVSPEPTFQLGKCEVEHRQIIGVFIQEGKDSPYALNTKPPSVYVRRHGTTFGATLSEIHALVAKNQSSASLTYGLREF